ncbi:MAG: tRNA threonylcarbamoyladenosine dehydratase [Eubacteriales bacterium]|nr:tRNA threonylcarbamoyladenosine dehydratase [Eubacteriales bacterium]
MTLEEERLNRTALLLTPEQMKQLKQSHIILFGLGGVGSFAAEALARVGVGHLTIVDNDTVAPSNLNRQLPALSTTVGQKKTDIMEQRLQNAAPGIQITAVDAFYLPEAPVEIPSDCSMVLDAIDTVSAKLHLAQVCKERGIPLVSCMGMGNRLNPTLIRIGDIFETNNCPLCKVMRRELRKRNIPALRCVYSLEQARKPLPVENAEQKSTGRTAPGSVSFVPSIAGLYMAYEAVRTLCGLE